MSNVNIFNLKLGGDIYALVSEFFNQTWLGIRQCLFIKKSGNLAIGKKSVNFDLKQFMIIRSNFNKILNCILKKKSFKLEIAHEKYAIVDKSTAFCLKLNKGDKEILLDYNTFKKLGEYFNEIYAEMLRIEENIKGLFFFKLFFVLYNALFITIF